MKTIASLLRSRLYREPAGLSASWLKRSFTALAVSTGLLTGGAQAAQNATLTTHHSFDGTISTDAAGPVKGLVLASDGNYYGCARSGWAGSGGAIPNSYRGSIFKVTPSGEYSILCNFDGTTHGATPLGTLSEGPDHQLYGVTINNSVANFGTVFKVSFDGTITTLHTFTIANSAAHGVTPDAVLIGSDGDLYITCRAGGTSNIGTILKMHADGSSPTRLVNFNGTNGSLPVGRLVEVDGEFWGTTETGGATNVGTVFKVTSTGTFSSVAAFDATHHRYPRSGLIKASNGLLYGTTYQGGLGNRGVIYSMSTSGTLTVVAEMTVAAGTNPTGTLVEGPDHNFYGLSYAGGAAGYGTIYRMTSGGTLSALLSFQNTSAPRGAASIGDLIFGADNHLWGTTTLGGVYISGGTAGTVFSADIGLTSPDLVVEAPVGTALTSGSASVNYGTVPNRTSLAKTFTLKNNGYATLNLTGASLTGGNAADFTLDTSTMSSSIEPGADTTLTVTLTPTAVGTRATTLQILSNDTSHPTFSIGLTSTATASSVFSFNTDVYPYVQGNTSAIVTVTRAVTNVAQTVQIHTQDGTDNVFPPYSSAVAGVDYNSLAGAATTVSFAVGQASKPVTITLKARTGVQPNRRFNVVLSDPSSGGTLGSITNATILIKATDTLKPVLVVTTPAVGSVFDAELTPSVEVTGTASDMRGIAKVTVTANGVLATATLGEPNGTEVPFSHSFAPVLGTNTVIVTSYDLRGNFTTITRTFTLTGGVTFTFTRSVPAAMALRADSVGNITLVATPARSANTFTPTTANANPRSCLVVPNAPVKITATSVNGYTFSHWTGLPADAVVTGNVATFTMPLQDLSVTATYVAAPFTGAAGSSSSFYGMVHATGGNAPSIATEGFLTGGLMVGTGAFTGTLVIDGISQPIVATFFGDGSCVFNVGGVLRNTLSFGGRTLALTYNASSGHDQISIVSVKDGNTSMGIAKRGYYSPTRKVAAGMLNETYSGYFTFAIPAKDQSPTKDKTTYPQGDGFGSLTLFNSGAVTVTGTLADGTAFTGSSALVDSTTCPFFIQLTTPGANTKLGALFGDLVFSSTSNSDVTATNLTWFRPEAVASPLYTSGWPDGIAVDLVGSLYTKTNGAQTTLALGAVNATSGNGKLEFTDGKLASTITKTQFNISVNSVSYLQGTAAGFTVSMGAYGAFSGSFTPNWTSPATTKPTFKGMMLQKGSNKGGFGYFLSNRLNDADPESGGVTLSAQ